MQLVNYITTTKAINAISLFVIIIFMSLSFAIVVNRPNVDVVKVAILQSFNLLIIIVLWLVLLPILFQKTKNWLFRIIACAALVVSLSLSIFLFHILWGVVINHTGIIFPNLAICLSLLWESLFLFGISFFVFGISRVVIQLKKEKIMAQEKQLLAEENLDQLYQSILYEENNHLFQNINMAILNLLEKSNSGLVDTYLQFLDFKAYRNYSVTGGKFTTIREELARAKQLIALFQVFGANTYHIEWQISPVIKNSISFPSLIMTSLIENMFTHGDLSSKQYPGFIKLFVDKKLITFETSNKIKNGTQQHSNHSGLAFIRKRLDAIVPNEYLLQTKVHEDYFYLTLSIEHEI